MSEVAKPSAEEPAAPTWPRSVKLKHPIEYTDERISSLEFRRGRAGDMKGISLQDGSVPANDLMVIASRLCGQPLKVIELLDIDDVGEVTDIALDFYVKYLTATKKR
jgi:hypothetical protein